MNKISQLISLLGGTGVLAEKLKIQPSAISNWKKLNKIPSSKHEAILEISSHLDINIDLDADINIDVAIDLDVDIHVDPDIDISIDINIDIDVIV